MRCGIARQFHFGPNPTKAVLTASLNRAAQFESLPQTFSRMPNVDVQSGGRFGRRHEIPKRPDLGLSTCKFRNQFPLKERSPMRHGTILMALKREREVVLAADGRARKFSPDHDDSRSTVDKLIRHEKLPLVVAVGGMVDLALKPTVDKRENPVTKSAVSDIIDCLREIRYERHMKIDELMRRLMSRIHPRVRDTFTYVETEDEENALQLTLIVGMVSQTGAEMEVLTLARTASRKRVVHAWYGPAHMNPYIESRKASLFALLAPSMSAESVGVVCVDEIRQAVNFEASIRDPHLRFCGWPVQIAIVRRSGVTSGRREREDSARLVLTRRASFPPHAQAWQLAQHHGKRTQFSDASVRLGKTVGDIATLAKETSAWSTDVTNTERGLDWQMKVGDARTNLKSVYPKIKT